jgi:hypothetical protein
MALPRAQISWTDDAGTGFIHVDVIPSIENTLSSKVTDFPLEDGSIVGEHIIHYPELIKLEVAQTQIPFEDSNEDGEPLEFVKTSTPLKLPKTRFKAKGLLLLLLAAEGALGAVTGAITGALGLGGGGGKSELKIERFKPPYENKDRINDLYDKLAGARLRGSAIKLEWLGRRWPNYYIDNIVYTRTKGAQIGRFSISLKQVVTVSTGTAKLPSPAEARLKAGLSGGNRPGGVTGDDEADAAKNSAGQSLLSSLKDSLLGG